MTNRLTRASLVGKNLFARKGNAVKKSKSRFIVMDLSAGQNHANVLRSLVSSKSHFILSHCASVNLDATVQGLKR